MRSQNDCGASAAKKKKMPVSVSLTAVGGISAAICRNILMIHRGRPRHPQGIDDTARVFSSSGSCRKFFNAAAQTSCSRGFNFRNLDKSTRTVDLNDIGVRGWEVASGGFTHRAMHGRSICLAGSQEAEPVSSWSHSENRQVSAVTFRTPCSPAAGFRDVVVGRSSLRRRADEAATLALTSWIKGGGR